MLTQLVRRLRRHELTCTIRPPSASNSTYCIPVDTCLLCCSTKFGLSINWMSRTVNWPSNMSVALFIEILKHHLAMHSIETTIRTQWIQCLVFPDVLRRHAIQSNATQSIWLKWDFNALILDFQIRWNHRNEIIEVHFSLLHSLFCCILVFRTEIYNSSEIRSVSCRF